MTPIWLKMAQQIQALSKTGLHFTEGPFDRQRYETLLEISHTLMETYGNCPPEVLRSLMLQESGYITPKVDVRAGIIEDDKILLVKEKDDGGWSLPGGFADVGDSPARSVEREVFEEAGLKVRATRLVAVLDRENPQHGHVPYPFHVYKMFFLCSLTGACDLRSGSLSHTGPHTFETEAAGFFALSELPELSISRVSPSQIAMLFRHHSDATLRTEFD
jgi:ADP-ribose pyrophosphatase YjhB (NUDIX family)